MSDGSDAPFTDRERGWSGGWLPSGSTLDGPQRLVDVTTGLPSLTSLFSELRPLTEQNGGATILYIHLPSNPLIEERFGWETLEAYEGLVTRYLARLRRDLQQDRTLCVVTRVFADDYVVVIPRRNSDTELPRLMAEEMHRHLQAIDAELAGLHEMSVGLSTLTPVAKIHPERRLYRGIQLAQRQATDMGRQRLSRQARQLDRCIEARDFRMVYQPLVDSRSLNVFGYEALVRCDAESLTNPHLLFNVAEQTGRVWPLSRVLRRMAVESLPHLPSDQMLFINLHPQDCEDPSLILPEPVVVNNASRLVLEITERAAIGDFDRFRNNIERLREAGAKIAVDDLGAGYATLNSVAELAPEFIKFDMTLIRGIDQSPIRRNLLRNMIAFAKETGAKAIAEGVETQPEFDTLRELACDFLQGFFLARPAEHFAAAGTLSPEAADKEE